MELSVSGRARRAAQTAAPQARAAVFKSGGGLRQTRTDRLDLSRQALSLLESMNRQEREAQRKLLEAKRQGGDQMDALTKSLKTAEKCRKIAARIQAGDRVPPEDLKYLMDNDSVSYKLAMVNRKPKEHPKEWDSVLEEEDRTGGGVSLESVSGGGDSAPAESACE